MRSIIIPHYGDANLLGECLDAIEATCDAEVVVVDNGTGEAWTTDVLVSLPTNRGFAAACNLGAKVASGDLLIFLNNDTVPHPGWIEAIMHAAGRAEIVGVKLVYPDGSIQHAGVTLGLDEAGTLTAWNQHDDLPAGPVPAVTGACMAIRADVFRGLHGFDEGFWNGYEDIDLCLRARESGFRCWYAPDAVVTHHESASGPERWTGVQANILRLHHRWIDRWQRLTS